MSQLNRDRVRAARAQGEWGDPDVLEQLRSKTTRFTLTEGETQTLNLKLTDGE